ncbi:hypothetical protein BFW38_08555 [Terasakiispira papahanaumokuakeensis]|uniref:UPF0761 membrane protein BFW38_08555 n=1 Tax=Terasakiispira papahanaumokuakeensis TaxID=197479 RepID=A0A1E2V9D7_9GAMM|nr:YihY family inner membrane protein [Terasakiispira papahanaumokuakeensis]ODC03587.1 hypothetical protein BFW38_08555 [Terasakiispira papahanaumokuakeensis]
MSKRLLMSRLTQSRVWVIVTRVIQRFFQDGGPHNAAALTYTTLFAVVPCLTVVYSMLSAIPSFKGVGDLLQSFLFEHFVPSTGMTVQSYLVEFAQQARQLTVVGVGILIVTALMMILTIERTFNGIWRVHKGRRGLQAFLLYWAVLSLGPLLLGAGFLLTSYVMSLPLIHSTTEALGGRGLLLRWLPLLSSGLAFTLLFWAVPNCQVRFKHAVAGGMAVAVAFELAKFGFTVFVSNFASYELIYGAFAAVPVFLLWIYLSWWLILLGAEWVAVKGEEPTVVALGDRQPALQGVMCLFAVWQAFIQGEHVSELTLRQRCGVKNLAQWQQLISWLSEHGWLSQQIDECWGPGRDFAQVSSADLLLSWPWQLPAVGCWPQALQALPLAEVVARDQAELRASHKASLAVMLQEAQSNAIDDESKAEIKRSD